ncbi:AAA family ATPase [Ectopseudomonas alcaliphila]|uniref:AAA family ATPase n=1 Tax=Ectopseudomonas alcaliphila TaxID=101564 RepID=UPI0027832543|nr:MULTISPECIES: AAA family ATPase [Pseudomonas]MDP9939745.1 NadR type nicotinamide-nucleotide adenylyltransferase [Pseudomonas sp. 3400]MDR7012688.1 NadR type nicotinamide-nucleotide adenylyltransferase [Pseudomonas alcaliphila]
MSKRFSIGLVVGKFAPLHLGHEWLIRQAQEQCEQLVLLSWACPELPGCEPERRANWLQVRFPELRSWVVTPEWVAQQRARGLALPDLPRESEPDTVQRQFVADFCLAVLGHPVDAVFTSEAYGDGFAAHLAGCFGRSVQHVEVDRARRQVPISATRLRADIHGLRDYLAPQVYADFVERIALLGGESTGKSSLALALAKKLGTRHAAEYGRELWEEQGGVLAYDDLLRIGRTQVAREQTLAGRCLRYLVCDTTPLTTLFYCRELFGRAEAELEQLAERRYQHLFLCADDFPFVQDGTRQDETFRRRQNQWYEQELDRRGWAFTCLTGSLAQRVEQVLRRLSG